MAASRPVCVSLPMEHLLAPMSTNPPAVAGYAHAPAADPAALDELGSDPRRGEQCRRIVDR